MWIHKYLRSRESEGKYWILHKKLADDEKNFYHILIRPNNNSIIWFRRQKKIWKTRIHVPTSCITCGETSNLSTVSALQVNVILLKNIYWSYKNYHQHISTSECWLTLIDKFLFSFLKHFLYCFRNGAYHCLHPEPMNKRISYSFCLI
jgi:hypothetical protein